MSHKTIPTKKNFDFSDRADDLNRRKTWMWSGITLVLAAIIFFWGWSMKINFSSFAWQNSKEQKLLSGIKNNWQEKFSSNKNDLKEEEKILVQNKLQTIINQTISASTTSTTSTETNL